MCLDGFVAQFHYLCRLSPFSHGSNQMKVNESEIRIPQNKNKFAYLDHFSSEHRRIFICFVVFYLVVNSNEMMVPRYM